MTGHLHAPPRLPVRRAVVWTFVLLLVPLALATVAGLVLLWPRGHLPAIPSSPGVTTQQAVVTDTAVADRSNPAIHAGSGLCQGEGHSCREDGRLVASYTVHAMVRDFVQGPEAMGHDSSTAM